MRAIFSSRASLLRAFNAGIEPMIPARHWATTSSGVEAMNIGPAMTGIRSLARKWRARSGVPFVETDIVRPGPR